MTRRAVARIIPGLNTSDGAGVRLRRTLGQSQLARLDPFLMLDEFSSDNADDYIGGFPSHPHRGFETVTYMLDGHMLHEDHLGNRGDLRPGDVQWMTAGRGIIHSEMPQQKQGRMRGFQLWLNLAAKDKMKPAAYRDVPASEIPWHKTDDGIGIKLIAGSLTVGAQALRGPIQAPVTEPIYADIALPANGCLSLPLPPSHNAFLYVFEGEVDVFEEGASAANEDARSDDFPSRESDAAVDDQAARQNGAPARKSAAGSSTPTKVAGQRVPGHAAALLGEGDTVLIQASSTGARLLLLAGKPLNEPIAQYGPFVMNNHAEIEQALRDYRDGTLTE
mgnify:CR=1 FL=1